MEGTPPPSDMASSSATPLDTGTSIPDFIQLQQIPVNYVQQVETDLLEPVVFSQGSETTDGFARFTLQNKGFLHSQSKLFISLKPTVNASNTDIYLPPHLGIAQVIKKAVLKVGNKTLNELDSWAGLHGVKSSLIANEVNLEREMYMTGRAMNHKFVYDKDASLVNASAIGLDTGFEDGTSLYLPDALTMNATSAAKVAESPTFMVDLSDLFPFLKLHQLPLYMIKEPINIELTFQPTTKFRAQLGGSGEGGVDLAQVIEIDRNELKFCADYIYYGASDEMERYAMANKDLNFSFADYRVIEHTTSGTELGSGVIRNLGMANRMVSRVITTFPYDKDTYNQTKILGQYTSIAPEINASGRQGALKYNIRYNDRFEYTSDVDNTSRLFSIFTDSEGIPFVTRSEYSDQATAGGFTDNEQFEDRDQSVDLPGHFFYLSSRLSNGRVGQRGIELHVSGTWETSGQKNPTLLRCYCEYMRVARLVDGHMEVYNA